MTLRDLIDLLETIAVKDAIIVTQPTTNDPAPTIHAPCSGTGLIAGVSDAACGGTGLNLLPPKARVIATGGTVTITPIPVNP